MGVGESSVFDEGRGEVELGDGVGKSCGEGECVAWGRSGAGKTLHAPTVIMNSPYKSSMESCLIGRIGNDEDELSLTPRP